MTIRAIAAATALALVTACASHAAPPTGLPPLPSLADPLSGAAGKGKIQHVVVIVQENRTFDDLFQGYPGADTQSYGYTSSGEKVKLKPVSMATKWDIGHNATEVFEACDGTGKLPGTKCRMDGFDREAVDCGIFEPCPIPHPQYGYVPKHESAPYFTMAHQYVLADRMFPSNVDGSSFISHQYLIAGQASSAVNYPAGVWGCDGGPTDKVATITQRRGFGKNIVACFSNQTLGDELDAAGDSWHYYTSKYNKDGGLWSAYQAIDHIRYGPDWKANVINPQTRFFSDVKNGTLPAVSWITPTCRNSDHAGCDSNHGPQWVTALVNAVGESRYWKSTAIVIFWDDYGGWYDHVPPPFEDYDGLGIRVPMLIVSPYAKKDYVSHVRYEHGSIMRFIEDQFGLARLAAADARATSPEADCFDFKQPPRAFKPIHAVLDERYFQNEPLDLRPPDSD